MAEIQETENPNKIQRKSQGKRSIPIALIQKKASRQVTFSKRRVGIFKKAGELSSLCGVEIAVIAFSEAGKLFSFGSPSADSVILRYLNSSSDRKQVIPEKKLGGFWWNEPIEEGLGLDELEELKNGIEGLRFRVLSRMNEINSSLVNYGNYNTYSNNYNVSNDQFVDFGRMNEMNSSLVSYDNYNANYGNNYNVSNEQSVDLGSMDNNYNGSNEQSVDFGSMGNNWNSNYPSEVASYEYNPMNNVASTSSWFGVGS